jgi:hypothetical protein
LQYPIPAKHTPAQQTSVKSHEQAEKNDPSGERQGVEGIFAALGLVREEEIINQNSIVRETFNKSNATQSTSRIAARQAQRLNFPSEDRSTRSILAAKQHGTLKSSARHESRQKRYDGLPPSPSFSRFKNRTSSGKSPPTVELPFPGSSFLEDGLDGKRGRGLTNLFRPKSSGRSTAKGESEATRFYCIGLTLL